MDVCYYVTKLTYTLLVVHSLDLSRVVFFYFVPVCTKISYLSVNLHRIGIDHFKEKGIVTPHKLVSLLLILIGNDNNINNSKAALLFFIY